jgi:hypothetical protein
VAKSNDELTARTCRRYLRLKYADKGEQVERFIRHIDETENWKAFTDADSITDEVLKPLDLEFEKASGES